MNLFLILFGNMGNIGNGGSQIWERNDKKGSVPSKVSGPYDAVRMPLSVKGSVPPPLPAETSTHHHHLRWLDEALQKKLSEKKPPSGRRKYSLTTFR